MNTFTHSRRFGMFGNHSIRREALFLVAITVCAFAILIIGAAAGGSRMMALHRSLDLAVEDYIATMGFSDGVEKSYNGLRQVAEGDFAGGSALITRGNELVRTSAEMLRGSVVLSRRLVDDLIQMEAAMHRYSGDARADLERLADGGANLDPEQVARLRSHIDMDFRALDALYEYIDLQGMILGNQLTEKIDSTEAAIDRLGRWLAFAGVLLAIGVAVVISVFQLGWVRRLTTSLNGLHDATKQVSEGDLSVRVPPTRRDEIGEITVAFNRMLDTLDENSRERKAVGQQLEKLAYYDTLTQLPNRTLFTERLNHALTRRRRPSERLAVMFLDMDRFKNINDTLGHEVGDVLLGAFADRVGGCLREGDTLGRLSGDEFAILLDQVSPGDRAATVAERIVEALSEPFHVDGSELYVTTSIGISLSPDDGTDMSQLLKKADMAMYRAKDSGRNCFRFHSDEMSRNVEERMRLEVSIHQALDRSEFELYYQPQINARSGEIIGAEALIRWQHPQYGMVSPAQFVPILEETGLINVVGEWVVRTAIAEAANWEKPLGVAVNLAARQLYDPYFSHLVEEVLIESGLDPARLELEITESVLMEDTTVVKDNLICMTALGVGLAIDDFGTGYSSMNYLKKFPASVLKLDRSFICDIDQPASGAIVHSVIDLGHALGMRVVAEGVETDKHLDALRGYNCDIIQGFLISGPLPADAFARFLRMYIPAEYTVDTESPDRAER